MKELYWLWFAVAFTAQGAAFTLATASATELRAMVKQLMTSKKGEC